jgi:outer membrane lipoprotein carrier protein
MTGPKHSYFAAVCGCIAGVIIVACATAAPPQGKGLAAPEVYPAVDSAEAPKKSQSPKVTAPKRVSQELPALLKEVEAKYSNAATLEATFTQVNEVASMNRKKTSSGLIWLKRPDKFRWQTNEPEPNLLVSNGAKFWFYTPPFDEGDNGQVIIKKSSEVQTDLARALLAGSFSAAKDITTITAKKDNVFTVVPHEGSAGTVKEAEVVIDASKKTIEKVTLVHEGGNRSEIKLSQITLGKKLDDTMFKFDPPPGTEVVKQ